MPERTIHQDAYGNSVLSYVSGEEKGRPAAYDIQLLSPTPAALDVIATDFAGWVVSAPAELEPQLRARGATIRRVFHTMRRALDPQALPAAWSSADLGSGLRAVPVGEHTPEEMFPAWRAAYPATHPDGYPGDDEGALTERHLPLLNGLFGPVLPCSRLAVDAGDQVRAGAVVVDFPGLGALVADVYRDPDPACAGLGARLLAHVLARAADDGITSIELSVTEGIPAQKVYPRLGFVTTSSLFTAIMPD